MVTKQEIESVAITLWSFEAPALHDDYPIEAGWDELLDDDTRDMFRARSRAVLHAAEALT